MKPTNGHLVGTSFRATLLSAVYKSSCDILQRRNIQRLKGKDGKKILENEEIVWPTQLWPGNKVTRDEYNVESDTTLAASSIDVSQ